MPSLHRSHVINTFLTAVSPLSDADEESESQDEDERELVQYLISNQVHFTSAKMNRRVMASHL